MRDLFTNQEDDKFNNTNFLTEEQEKKIFDLLTSDTKENFDLGLTLANNIGNAFYIFDKYVTDTTPVKYRDRLNTKYICILQNISTTK